ncbi:hypothetical protein ACU8V7_00530 [Zobellia nedashkovskayae]
MAIQGNENSQEQLSLTIEKPNLWKVDNPYLYKAVTSIVEDGKIID